MKFREPVLKALRQMRDLEEDDTSRDDEFQCMHLEEVLNDYLHWEGIHGYVDIIMDTVKAYYEPEDEVDEEQQKRMGY